MRASRAMVAGLAAAVLFITTSAQAEAASAEQIAAAASASDKSAQAASKSASAAATSALAAASAASSAESAVRDAWVAPHAWALYLVPVFVLVAAVVAIQRIAKKLPATWSLGDALSEEVMMPAYSEAVPARTDAPAVPKTLIMDNDKKAVLIPEMHASSSRVIALMGMMAILFLFLGFGVFAIFEFGATGKVPESMERVSTFLTAGLTLFAPYLVNKFASVFKLSPGGK